MFPYVSNMRMRIDTATKRIVPTDYARSYSSTRYAGPMTDTQHNAPQQRPSPSRRAIVVLRWLLAVGWALAIAFILPLTDSLAGLAVQAAAFALLSFLLANALWQHMTLKSACATAVIVVCLVITVSEVFRSLVMNQTAPESLVAGLCGSILGAVAARPLLRHINRKVSQG